MEPAISFAFAAVLVELTPGPNMAWLALLAATEGRARGFAAVAGVALGLGLMGAAAALGLAALVQTQPQVYQALRWAGMLYLLWLALEAWRAASSEAGDKIGQNGWHYFWQGVVTNVLNPKAAVFYVTILPSFLPAAPSLSQVAGFSTIYVAVASLVHGAIVSAAGTAQGLLASPARVTLVRRIMAVSLVGVAVWMYWRG
jgi:threonine/homoserine/homoserine lactone efflux protein